MFDESGSKTRNLVESTMLIRTFFSDKQTALRDF